MKQWNQFIGKIFRCDGFWILGESPTAAWVPMPVVTIYENELGIILDVQAVNKHVFVHVITFAGKSGWVDFFYNTDRDIRFSTEFSKILIG